MSGELCDPKIDFSTVIVSDLILFFFSLFSSPLYLSYFIFFSPYLLKLAYFLSPLFFTVFILLLSDIVREKDYQGSDDYDLGLYETLFGTRLTNCPEEETQLGKISEGEKTGENQEPGSEMEEKGKKAAPFPVVEEMRFGNFLKILDQFERMSKADDKPVPTEGVRQNAATKIDAKVKAAAAVSSNADHGVRQNVATKIDIKVKAAVSSDVDHGVRQNVSTKPKVEAQSDVDDNVDDNLKADSFRTWDRNSSNSSSFGSMRKEKEWKRTLACKLFEERHNVDGGEGMDSLWEAYEKDSSKPKQSSEKKKSRSKKTSEVEFNVGRYGSDQEDEDGDEEDEVVGSGQLCCLHAIKLSTGKLNLGMGRPNLVKISRAIRGFGWLHHVGKHSKKVHNNNGDRY